MLIMMFDPSLLVVLLCSMLMLLLLLDLGKPLAFTMVLIVAYCSLILMLVQAVMYVLTLEEC